MYISNELYQFEFDATKEFYKRQMFFLMQCDVSIEYCRIHDIGVKCGNVYGYIGREDDRFHVYNKMIKVCTFSMTGDNLSSQALQNTVQGNEEREKGAKSHLLSILLPCFYYAYNIHSGKIKCKEKQSEWFTALCTEAVPLLGEVRHYTGNEKFYIHEEGDRVNILYNGIEKKDFCFPSFYYPMPEPGDFYVYTPENTKTLQDDGCLARIASDMVINPMKPYKGTSDLYDKLKAVGYADSHRLELYGGWVISLLLGDIRHRLWLVIDGVSIIDVGYWEKCQEKVIIAALEGHLPTIDDGSDIDSTWSFKDVFYGQNPDCVYVGTRTRTETMIQMVLELSSTFRNHPGINNLQI